MNSHASNGRSRHWPHALLESALLTSALLMASSVALANAPAVPEAPKALVKELHQAKNYTITSPPTEPLEMAKPVLPDLSGYTTEAALKKDCAQQARQDHRRADDGRNRPEGIHRR